METRVFSVSFGEASLFFSRVKRREEKINKNKHRNNTKVLSIYIYIYFVECSCDRTMYKKIYIYLHVFGVKYRAEENEYWIVLS